MKLENSCLKMVSKSLQQYAGNQSKQEQARATAGVTSLQKSFKNQVERLFQAEQLEFVSFGTKSTQDQRRNDILLRRRSRSEIDFKTLQMVSRDTETISEKAEYGKIDADAATIVTDKVPPSQIHASAASKASESGNNQAQYISPTAPSQKQDNNFIQGLSSNFAKRLFADQIQNRKIDTEQIFTINSPQSLKTLQHQVNFSDPSFKEEQESAFNMPKELNFASITPTERISSQETSQFTTINPEKTINIEAINLQKSQDLQNDYFTALKNGNQSESPEEINMPQSIDAQEKELEKVLNSEIKIVDQNFKNKIAPFQITTIDEETSQGSGTFQIPIQNSIQRLNSENFPQLTIEIRQDYHTQGQIQTQIKEIQNQWLKERFITKNDDVWIDFEQKFDSLQFLNFIFKQLLWLNKKNQEQKHILENQKPQIIQKLECSPDFMYRRVLQDFENCQKCLEANLNKLQEKDEKIKFLEKSMTEKDQKLEQFTQKTEEIEVAFQENQIIIENLEAENKRLQGQNNILNYRMVENLKSFESASFDLKCNHQIELEKMNFKAKIKVLTNLNKEIENINIACDTEKQLNYVERLQSYLKDEIETNTEESSDDEQFEVDFPKFVQAYEHSYQVKNNIQTKNAETQTEYKEKKIVRIKVAPKMSPQQLRPVLKSHRHSVSYVPQVEAMAKSLFDEQVLPKVSKSPIQERNEKSGGRKILITRDRKKNFDILNKYSGGRRILNM